MYRAFKERKAYRWRAFEALFTLLVIEALIVAYIAYNAIWFFSYGVWIVLFSFIFGFFYLVSRPWAVEWYETDIFVDLYEAFKLLELCSEENEDSLFYSRKATNKVRHAIKRLNSWSNSIEGIHSKLIEKEYTKPLRKLRENLETRILSRIAQYKDIKSMESVLQGLAKLFSEARKPISLDDIISKNEDLERYEQISVEEAPTTIRIILSKEPIKLSCSIGLSFLIITIAILIHWKLFQTDLLDLISSLTTFLEILAVGIALGLGIYAILRQKA